MFYPERICPMNYKIVLAIVVFAIVAFKIFGVFLRNFKVKEYKGRLEGFLSKGGALCVEFLSGRSYLVDKKFEGNIVSLVKVTWDEVKVGKPVKFILPKRMYDRLESGKVYKISYNDYEHEVVFSTEGSEKTAESELSISSEYYCNLTYIREAMQQLGW